MPSVSASDYGGRSEKELALWMLDKMRNSEEFLGVLRAARAKGRRDVLDTPDYVARHKGRLKKLYEGDDEETVETPASLAGEIDALVERDMLAGREELIEKAIAAYIERHPEGSKGLPEGWQSTFELARAEIEGTTSGAFPAGFVSELAAAAREEMDRQVAAERERDAGRERE